MRVLIFLILRVNALLTISTCADTTTFSPLQPNRLVQTLRSIGSKREYWRRLSLIELADPVQAIPCLSQNKVFPVLATIPSSAVGRGVVCAIVQPGLRGAGRRCPSSEDRTGKAPQSCARTGGTY